MMSKILKRNRTIKNDKALIPEVEKLRNLLSRHGYDRQCVKSKPNKADNGSIFLRFKHNELIEDPALNNILRQIKGKSIDTRIFKKGGAQFIYYEIYLNSLNEFTNMTTFPKSDTLLEKVSSALFHFDYCFQDIFGCPDYSDAEPTVRFLLQENILRFEFSFPTGTYKTDSPVTGFDWPRYDRIAIYELFSSEDYRMAAHLESLNKLNKSYRNFLNIAQMIEFEVFEVFNILLEQKKLPLKEMWLNQPQNKRRLRRERIERLLESQTIKCFNG